MNKILAGILFVCFTAFVIYFAKVFIYNEKEQNNSSNLTKIGEISYELEKVSTQEDLEKGLAKYDSIRDNQGMLFVFDTPGRYSFWMKDMKFNIDIIFLNEKKEVVQLFKNVKFETHENVFEYRKYTPDVESKYVIELKEGEIVKNKVKIGDIISFQ